MSFSNLPPGMSRSDMDHVNGVVRCEACGADITRAIEDEPEGAECVCPGGCYDPSDDLYDAHVDRLCEEAARGRSS